MSAEAGIYIIIAGKVRLVNQLDEKICTLDRGDTFGECQFFINDGFKHHSIRAGLKTKLIYLSPESLFPLITQYPPAASPTYLPNKKAPNKPKAINNSKKLQEVRK